MYPDPNGPKPGDPVPNFALPDTSKTLFLPRSPLMAGQLGLVLLLGDPASEPAKALYEAAAAKLPALAASGVVIIAITAAKDPIENLGLVGDHPAFPVLADIEGTAHTDFGSRDRPTAFLVSRNSFVEAVFDDANPTALIDAAVKAAADPALHPAAETLAGSAPALWLPNLLSAEFCRELIELWATDNCETGITRPDGVQVVEDTQETLKSRRDHVIKDDALLKRLQRDLSLRLLPEIQKVFFFKVTKQEFVRIGRYDAATGGVFRPHRDNNPPTQRRRFALTINLNTGDYEGGALRFPEYGPHLYAPPPGGAVVFPCSLIHEVTPVTSGTRFALISFFF